MKSTVRAPMPTFTGSIGGLRFHAGVVEAELEEAQAKWFRDRGYSVIEPPTADEESTYSELQAEAKELGLPATGKKADLAAAIANERGRLAAEAQAAETAESDFSADSAAATAEALAFTNDMLSLAGDESASNADGV